MNAGSVGLRVDPIPALCSAGDPALAWAVRHDLQDEPLDAQVLWDLPEARRLLRRQRPDGSWRYTGGSARIRSDEDYNQLATYKALLPLVAKYRLDVRHPAIPRAAHFLLGYQTPQGDLRGMYGSQYSPNYTAGIVAVLVEAGYVEDRRVDAVYHWLLRMRQHDGGWVIPFRTRVGPDNRNFANVMRRPTLEADRTKRSSHLITGIVLRAFAAHPRYRLLPEAGQAAGLLATRLFKADLYPDRKAPLYWLKFAFPFRWTDLVSTLDAILRTGFGSDDPNVASALRWLGTSQGSDGLWHSTYEHPADKGLDLWVTLAITRLFRLQAAHAATGFPEDTRRHGVTVASGATVSSNRR